MKTILYKAETRGHVNHGWLNSYHTFSFGNYHNPERMHFGVLRVLNDDTVEGGMGFSKHPHENMEIITIPLEGDLEHQDSMGNTSVIKEGDIQAMSTGTGIFHSEYNKNKDRKLKFLQIWVFPKQKNVTPRYDQISIREIEKKNDFFQIVSPNEKDQGVWIHQDAWFFLGNFDAGKASRYALKKSNHGVFIFLLNGEVEVEGQTLGQRDGLALWDLNEINFEAKTKSRVLLMEIPMQP
jgi:redox-sensitive bicupin YhaK (pirin superfamily)